MNNMTDKLISMGGKFWEKGDMKRVYLNEWLDLAGVEISRYKTGNIKSAYFNGAKISNSKASELGSVKVFWDCNAEKLMVSGQARALDDVLPGLKSAIGI